MPYIPAPNCFEATLQFDWQTQQCATVLNFEKTGGATAAEMLALGSALWDWWVAEMSPLLSDKLYLLGVKVTDLTTSSSPVIEYTPLVPANGDISGQSVPNNVALVTSFLTDSRGRSFRGRAYTPGLTPGSLTNSVLVAAGQVAALVAAYAAMGDAANVLDFIHIVLSRFSGGLARTTAVATPVTSYRTEQYVDSQRRRLEGRGS